MGLTLTVMEGPHKGRVFTFDEHDHFIVGRSSQAHFRLATKDRYFSRFHFMVEVNPPNCRLMDMGSTNGTQVNGQQVKEADLKDGDQIKAGHTILHVAVQPKEGEAGEVVEAVEAAPSRPPSRPPSLRPGGEGSPSRPPSRPPSHGPTPLHEAETIPPTTHPEENVYGTARPEVLGPRLGDKPSAPPSSHLPSRARLVAGVCRVCGNPAGPPTGGLVAGPTIPAGIPLCTDCVEQISSNAQPVGGYHVVRELGRGGMGIVSLALRDADATVVALKTIIPKVAGSRTEVERFLREASILRSLDHPNIVPFREMGESNGQLYFAMDYIQGTDAARILRDHAGPLPVARAVRLVCQLLDALDYAHGKQLVHRDIKPANMLVASLGGKDTVKLADFGLARVYQASQMSGLTMKGDMGGTVAFMAPEQITQFREVRPAVDQYAAAATLYNLLTKEIIYDLPRHLSQQILKVLQENPIPLQQRRPELPKELGVIIHRALAREPEARYPDVRTMRQALTPFG